MENEKKDNFYEERFQQIKSDLFIGDERHMLGKNGSYMFLYRLFEECYTFDEIFSILDNVYRNAKRAGEVPFSKFDNTTKMFMKKNHAYLITDSKGKLKVDFWDGEKFSNTNNPKLIALHANAHEFSLYIDN